MAYKSAFLSFTHTLVLDIGAAHLLRTYRVILCLWLQAEAISYPEPMFSFNVLHLSK